MTAPKSSPEAQANQGYLSYKEQILRMTRAEATTEARRLQKQLQECLNGNGSEKSFWCWVRETGVVDWAHGSSTSWPRVLPGALLKHFSSNVLRSLLFSVTIIGLAVLYVWASNLLGMLSALATLILFYTLISRSVDKDLIDSEVQRMALSWQGVAEDQKFAMGARSRYTWIASIEAEPASAFRLFVYVVSAVGAILAAGFDLLFAGVGFGVLAISWQLLWVDIRTNATPPHILLLGRSGELGTSLHQTLYEIHFPAKVVSLLVPTDAGELTATRRRNGIWRVWPKWWAEMRWLHVVGNLMASSSIVLFDSRSTDSSSLAMEKALATVTRTCYLEVGGANGVLLEDYIEAVTRNPSRFW
jgi:hypothetical protein